ncbi:MAG TPA: Imm26 family immunity protein [Janthinobacterium sp.]|nr:Imm26 family immunity protein [Janthinobacterium sp.]
MKQLPYAEGSWFAVPLKSGGYGAGVVARMAPGGRIILAYLFGPKREEVPTLAELAGLRPGAAIRRLRTGDLGLINRRWPIIGQLDNWERGDWPMPPFIRRAELLKRAWRANYLDADPGKLEREESIPYTTQNLESDSLYGYGATEILLSKLLEEQVGAA